jgi:hypothetical protein
MNLFTVIAGISTTLAPVSKKFEEFIVRTTTHAFNFQLGFERVHRSQQNLQVSIETANCYDCVMNYFEKG